MEKTNISKLAGCFIDRLLSKVDLDDGEGLRELAEEILSTPSGGSVLNVRDGKTISEAIDRLPSSLCRCRKLAIMVIYNPLHPMLLSDLSAIAHFTSKCDTEADIRWCAASSSLLDADHFTVATLSDDPEKK